MILQDLIGFEKFKNSKLYKTLKIIFAIPVLIMIIFSIFAAAFAISATISSIIILIAYYMWIN